MEFKKAITEIIYKNSTDTSEGVLIDFKNIHNLIDKLDEAFSLYSVSKWVAISSTEQPEIMTDVMVKYKDGRKEVAFFDGDKRFYIEKDDRDITETIVEWHKLP